MSSSCSTVYVLTGYPALVASHRESRAAAVLCFFGCYGRGLTLFLSYFYNVCWRHAAESSAFHSAKRYINALMQREQTHKQAERTSNRQLSEQNK